MPITPINPYVPAWGTLPNVTPFTYRDGRTFINRLESIITYLNRIVIPYVNEHIAEFGEEFETEINGLIQSVNDAIAANQTNVDQKVSDLTTFVNTSISDNKIYVDTSIADNKDYVDTSIADNKGYVDAQVASIIGSSVQVQDPVVAGIIRDNSSETYVQLSATYGGLARRGLGGFFAALDMREDSGLVILNASDSTGDAANEFFERSWKETLAAVWPERPARVRRWDLGSTVYGAWETWQLGDSVDEAVVFQDSFTGDTIDVLTHTPDLGSAWVQGATGQAAYYSITGGRLVHTASGGQNGTLRNLMSAREGSDFKLTGLMSLPAGTTGQTSEIMVAAPSGGGTPETGYRLQISRQTSTNTLTFDKYMASTLTTLGTFTTYTPGDDAEFEISLDGNTVTAKVGTETITADLSDTERDGFLGDTSIVLRSTTQNYAVDNLLFEGLVASDVLPGVDVYNGGAAGQTAEYQREHLATISPVAPDLLVINHGHNYVYGTVDSFLTSIEGLVADINIRWGINVPVVVTSQNPRFGSHVSSVHLAMMQAIKDLALARGWGYIPSYEAFSARTDGGHGWMYTTGAYDDIHPGLDIAPGETESGRDAYARIASGWIKSQTERPALT